jgi:hypothetical protein
MGPVAEPVGWGSIGLEGPAWLQQGLARTVDEARTVVKEAVTNRARDFSSGFVR